MMKKLIALVLILTFATSALADDLIPAPWANDGSDNRIMPEGLGSDPCSPFAATGPVGLQGSTYAQWTYDDPCGVFYWDPAETFWFVRHPEKEDPGYVWGDSGEYAAQVWGSQGDPCDPAWNEVLPGDRNGGVTYLWGSWDVANFVHDQPYKDIWVQITYFGGLIDDPCFGPGAGSWIEDPCVPEELWGWWEGLTDPCDPCSWDEFEGPMSEWPTWAGDAMYTWMEGGGEEIWSDAELVNRQTLADGWIHDVYAMTLEPNPTYEWFEFGWWEGTPILIDQVIIETLCYVPEPATMVLLGLGGLLVIRRKR